jgi:8-oxo-dGTP diphosphatase
VKHAVVVILRNNLGEFLIGQRSASQTSGAHFWCPVSGGIEPGETEKEAVVRESMEEIGVKVEPIVKVGELDVRDKTIRLHFWIAKIISGTPQIMNDEFSQIGWYPIASIRNLKPIFEENLGILEAVAGRPGDGGI